MSAAVGVMSGLSACRLMISDLGMARWSALLASGRGGQAVGGFGVADGLVHDHPGMAPDQGQNVGWDAAFDQGARNGVAEIPGDLGRGQAEKPSLLLGEPDPEDSHHVLEGGEPREVMGGGRDTGVVGGVHWLLLLLSMMACGPRVVGTAQAHEEDVQ